MLLKDCRLNGSVEEKGKETLILLALYNDTINNLSDTENVYKSARAIRIVFDSHANFEQITAI